jgi:AcrR family transcriptional regulator
MNDSIVTRGERTRTEITDAAHRLFLERGYHGTSMRQIAQEAGIALGGIYNHFASKEEIFLAVLLEHHPIVDVIPAMKAAEGETIEAFVRDAAARMVAEMGDRKDFLNLVFIELVEFKGQHIPDLFQIFYPQIMAFAQRFLQGQGNLRPIPLPTLVRAFIGLFFSYVMTEMIMGAQMPAGMQERAFDHFVDIYLHGILTD